MSPQCSLAGPETEGDRHSSASLPGPLRPLVYWTAGRSGSGELTGTSGVHQSPVVAKAWSDHGLLPEASRQEAATAQAQRFGLSQTRTLYKSCTMRITRKTAAMQGLSLNAK